MTETIFPDEDLQDEREFVPLAEQPSNPYYRLIDKAIEVAGYDPEEVTRVMQEHPVISRVAANTVTVGRYFAGAKLLDVYNEAVDRGDTLTALVATGAFVAVLATDSIDGWIAHRGNVAGHWSGKILDSLSDVMLRLKLAKTVLKESAHPALDRLRMGGEALVASSSIIDVFQRKYQATMMGKVKVNFDAGFAASEMVRGAFGDEIPEVVERATRRISDSGRIGGLALSYADGIDRWRKKYQDSRAIA